MPIHPPTRRNFLEALAVTLTALPQLATTCGDEKSKSQPKSPERWEPDVRKLEAAFAKRNPPTADVVFIGSSTIRRWKLQQSFPALNAVNHGFGGSQLSDSVHFFERLVIPAHPHTVVLYAGDNDLSAGKSPETVCQDFQLFLDKATQHLPNCRRIIFLGIKPSIKRWAIHQQGIKANQLISEVCKKHPKAVFIDTWPAGLDSAGQPNPALLDKDDLHLNDEGYKVWTKLLLPALQ